MADLEELKKEVKRRKRIANEWAMQLHDLVEECLPASFEELPKLADSTYQACVEWQQAVDRLKEVEH